MLVKQRFGRTNPRVGMEPPPHHAVMQRVVESEERHALMMDHVTTHHDSRRAAGFAAPRIVQRLVVTVIAQHGGVAGERELSQISGRCDRFNPERKSRRIRRDDQVAFLTALQSQRRHTEGAVLINIDSGRPH